MHIEPSGDRLQILPIEVNRFICLLDLTVIQSATTPYPCASCSSCLHPCFCALADN